MPISNPPPTPDMEGLEIAIREEVERALEQAGVICGVAPVGDHKIYKIWKGENGNLKYECESVPQS